MYYGKDIGTTKEARGENGMKDKHTLGELRQMQSLPLKAKIQMTRRRIRDWIDEFGEDGVYVSFSGGKDSTVLLDIARKDYPDIKAIFVNTGLEYPSVRRFALSKENVTELKPTMNFRDVIIKYGYPIISKEVSRNVGDVQKLGKDCFAYRMFDGSIAGSVYDKSNYAYLINAPFKISSKCCDVMKKKPLHKASKKKMPITAQMAEESRQRLSQWIQNGCNAFEIKSPISNPMSFWTECDILTYIHENNLDIADAYGQVVVKNDGIDGQINIHDYLGDYRDCQYETTGCKRTGCIFCGFGIKQDKQRFVRLSKQEPKLCDYVMRGGEFSESGMWQPSKNGLGYWFILEWLNVHGKLGIGIPNRKRYLSEYLTNEVREYLLDKGRKENE